MRATLEGRTRMRDVKVKRDDLLKIIRTNREKHIVEYDEAIAGYKEMAMELISKKEAEARKSLEQRLAAVRIQVEDIASADPEDILGGIVTIIGAMQFNLPVPQNHSKDYDQVIRMLELSVDGEISIRSDEFACYVMDDWDWKTDFTNVSNSYKVGARR